MSQRVSRAKCGRIRSSGGFWAFWRCPTWGNRGENPCAASPGTTSPQAPATWRMNRDGTQKLPRFFFHLSIRWGDGPQMPQGGKNGTDSRQSKKGPATGDTRWKIKIY